MSAPAALVGITVQALTDIPSELLADTQHPYLLVWVGDSRLGRSRLIAKDQSRFDLGQERMEWSHEVPAFGGPVQVRAQLWDDRGDSAPRCLTEITGSIEAPYLGGPLQFGSVPRLSLFVRIRPIPRAPRAIPVPRVTPDRSLGTTVTLTPALIVELADIEGLYRPVNRGSSGRVRCERAAGYLSEDHQGRIFLNNDLGRNWVNGFQSVVVTARVSAARGSIPPDARVCWSVVSVDDPTNDDPWCHRRSGPVIDPDDYDDEGGPIGAGPGARAEPERPGGRRGPRAPWRAAEGFSLIRSGLRDAETQLVGGESKVVFRCPEMAGAAFFLRAEVQASTPVESFGTRSGVMTMWHRLDLETVRMKSATPLPLDDLPAAVEPACIQLDFHPERVVPDKEHMSTSWGTLGVGETRFMDAHLRRAATRGWFCILTACLPFPVPPAAQVIFRGMVKLRHNSEGVEYFDLEGELRDARAMNIAIGDEEIGFLITPNVFQREGRLYTRCWITPHEALREFEVDEGVMSSPDLEAAKELMSPRLRVTRRRKPTGDRQAFAGGYELPEEIAVSISGPGDLYPAGISPTKRINGQWYLYGRVVVYTHHSRFYDHGRKQPTADFNVRIVPIVMHEIIHGFGLPHMCASFDYRTPLNKTCVMNYPRNWVMDDHHRLIPGTSRRLGGLCARHLRELRRAQLFRNPALGW
jgi:hypothetical protein